MNHQIKSLMSYLKSSYSKSVSNPYWTVQFKLVSQHSRTPIIIKRSIHSFRSFPDDAFETHCEKIHAQWVIPVIATPLMSPAAVSFKETYCTYVIGKPYWCNTHPTEVPGTYLVQPAEVAGAVVGQEISQVWVLSERLRQQATALSCKTKQTKLSLCSETSQHVW